MPKKLERCIKKVRKSLKKYGRRGSPYAICKASIRKKQQKDKVKASVRMAMEW